MAGQRRGSVQAMDATAATAVIRLAATGATTAAANRTISSVVTRNAVAIRRPDSKAARLKRRASRHAINNVTRRPSNRPASNSSATSRPSKHVNRAAATAVDGISHVATETVEVGQAETRTDIVRGRLAGPSPPAGLQ